MPGKIVCSKCGKEKPEKEFFMKKDHTRDNMCKPCLTAFIDNQDPQTFLWILEKFNVPYIEEVWISLSNKIYKKNPAAYGSSSVIGTYLRQMNMVQYKDYSYEDTDRLAFEAEKRKTEQSVRQDLDSPEVQELAASLKEQLERGEISEAEYNTLNPLNFKEIDPDKDKLEFIKPITVDEESIRDNLDEDEIQYLSLKWGVTYRPSQWVQMEDLYNKYAEEYDLNIDREESLKSICRTTIKANEALEIGDYNAYKALSAVNDQLRKSSKFTESQNAEGRSKYLDSIGELVALCEKEGGIIEQFPSPDDYPQDKIDFTIKDMKQYYYNLVTKELGLGTLIESYIKKLEEHEEISIDQDDFILSAEQEAELALADEEAAAFQEYLDNDIALEAAALQEKFSGGAENGS